VNGDGESWGELTEAERAGVVYRMAALILGSPSPRDWAPDRMRQENPEGAFLHQLADAIDAEAAARAARSRLRAVTGGGRPLAPPGARRGAPALRIIDGYAAPPPLAAGLPQKSTPGGGCPLGRSRSTSWALPQVMTRFLCLRW